MIKKLSANKTVFTFLIPLCLLVLLVCGGCSSQTIFSRFAMQNTYRFDYEELNNFDKNYTLHDGKYYTDKIHPNEKQREKAYNLQKYLLDIYYNDSEPFYKKNDVYNLELLNYTSYYGGSSLYHHSVDHNTDEDTELLYNNIYNEVLFTFKYNEKDHELKERFSQIIEYIDTNFYTELAEITDTGIQTAREKTEFYVSGIYNNNAFISCRIAYNESTGEISLTYTIDYRSSLDYVRGYEDLTDKLSKNLFLLSSFDIDNEIQRLSFKNTDSHSGGATQIVNLMKIDLFLQDRALQRIYITTTTALSPENKNAIYCVLEKLGASSNETENIIKKIDNKTILDSKSFKEGDINISTNSNFNQYIILEFWKE